jgi:hypothetical protein
MKNIKWEILHKTIRISEKSGESGQTWRKKISFFHDNAHHFQKYLQRHGNGIGLDPSNSTTHSLQYSPILDPSDYYLFQKLKKQLVTKTFSSKFKLG